MFQGTVTAFFLFFKTRNKHLNLSFDLHYINCDLKKKKFLSKAAVGL